MRGTPIKPFSFENCIPVTGDAPLVQLRWQGGDDFTPLAGRAVRFRFKLSNVKLYAFWVSLDASVRSDS